MGDTDFMRDAILGGQDKMGGKTYGLTIGMLIGGEIERREVHIVKKSHVGIIVFPLGIIETRAIMDKISGRIEIPSIAQYNLNKVDISPTFFF